MLLVQKERVERGLSQSKLERMAGICQSSMSRIERGKEPAYPRRGKRIAEALGWQGDPAELFEEVDADAAANSR